MTNYTIVKPSFELFEPCTSWNYMQFLELCARNCYKSEDKIGKGTAEKLLKKVVNDFGHYSVVEHASCIMRLFHPDPEGLLLGWTMHVPLFGTRSELLDNGDILISGNLRMWLELEPKLPNCPFSTAVRQLLHQEWPFFFSMPDNPVKNTAKYCELNDNNPYNNHDGLTEEQMLKHMQLTGRFIGSRSMSHQLVRHRLAAYCLAGDTKILRYNQGRDHLTIEELYKRQEDNKLSSRNKLMELRSKNENGIIVPNKFVKVIKSGLKDVYKVTTKIGYSIKSSIDHIYFNSTGEVKLKDLSVGDKVFVNGIPLYQDKKWFIEKTNCELCGDDKNLENHHIDMNPLNDDISNKQTLCITCHNLLHKGYNVKKVIEDEIVSIEYVGKEITYDIEMEPPYHNFVANGFVVHNSQESQRYCNYGKKGFQFIIPPSIKKLAMTSTFICDTVKAYETYLHYVDAGIKPEDARELLPNACKTEVIATYTLGMWRHLVHHRGHNPKAQWQIREMVLEAEKQINKKLPFKIGG